MAMKPDSSAEDSAEMLTPLARRFQWADSPQSVHKFIVGLAVLCGILFLMDFVWHRHAKVPGEELYGFHAIAGFVSFTLIVLGARALRVFIGRDESFYAPHGVDSEDYPEADTERLAYDQKTPDSLKTLRDEALGRVGPKSTNDSGASS